MYFPNAFRKSFLGASTLHPTTGVTTQTLTAGQIGFFAPGNFSGTTNNNSTLTVQSSGTIKPFYVVGGSYFTSDKIGAHGGYKESWKSKLVNPKYISRIIKVAAKPAANHVVKVSTLNTVGVGLAADTTYRLRLDVKGSPALRFLNHQLYKTLDSYTGCASVANPTYVKDPVATFLAWKDQVNTSPILKDMVQARVYKYVAAQSATGASTVTTSQATIPMTTQTGIVVGQKAVGTGIPANSFVTTANGTTIIIKYPTQAVAPTLGASVAVTFFTDVYTEAGTVAYIPGTSIATGLTSAAYAAADASGFTYSVGQEPHLEFTAAYAETTFGTCTFTPTDKYDLEPLVSYVSLVDESGNPCQTSAFAFNSGSTNPYLSSHGIEVQAPVQASGYGETALRDLILSNRYLQNAYPDSSRVESLRMREIEADPMLAGITRSSLYDQLIVIHNVPRWNNPSSTFDNDQYMLQFFFAQGATLDTSTSNNVAKYFYDAAVAAQGGSSIFLESY